MINSRSEALSILSHQEIMTRESVNQAICWLIEFHLKGCSAFTLPATIAEAFGMTKREPEAGLAN